SVNYSIVDTLQLFDEKVSSSSATLSHISPPSTLSRLTLYHTSSRAFAKTGERDVEPAQATYGIVISSPPSSTVSSPLLLLLLLLLFGASAFSLLLFPSTPHASNNRAELRATVKTGSFAERNLSSIYYLSSSKNYYITCNTLANY